jgi:DNA-binding NarL/FixJ family response regulator
MKKIRHTVFLADDHPIVLDGLRDVLRRDGRFEIVGEAGNGEDALRFVRSSPPDALVLDIEMPVKSGLDVAEAIHAEQIPVAVLILTMYNQESIFNRAMDLGVTGYMLKDSAGTEIVRAVTAVLDGDYYISQSLLKYALRVQPSSRDADNSELTPVESRVLSMIAMSRTTSQIAEELNLSPRTIEHHRQHICRKLHLSGNYALLRYALENKQVIGHISIS